MLSTMKVNKRGLQIQEECKLREHCLRIWCSIITFVHIGIPKIYYYIIFLAFMCHHNTFLLYCSIEDTSLGKWNKVTHASIFISFVMMVLMAFGGYATFTQNVQGIYHTSFERMIQQKK